MVRRPRCSIVEQNGSGPPCGKALNQELLAAASVAIDLARRGWDVARIDVTHQGDGAEPAIGAHGDPDVEVRFIEGDVAAHGAAEAGSGFRLVLDFGTVHGMSPEERAATGRDLNSVTTEDATLLMYATAPGHRGPLPRGMSHADIEATYPGWKVTDEREFDTDGTPGSFRRAHPAGWYRLQR